MREESEGGRAESEVRYLSMTGSSDISARRRLEVQLLIVGLRRILYIGV
jgi:hypothetical protein